MPGYKVGTCINDGDCSAKDWARATGETALAVILRGEGKGAGAAADFFGGSNYTPKVLAQMGEDIYYGFLSISDSLAADAGRVSEIVGNDGTAYLRLQVDGALNSEKGVFEYIKDAAGNINHRLFVPGGG